MIHRYNNKKIKYEFTDSNYTGARRRSLFFIRDIASNKVYAANLKLEIKADVGYDTCEPLTRSSLRVATYDFYRLGDTILERDKPQDTRLKLSKPASLVRDVKP